MRRRWLLGGLVAGALASWHSATAFDFRIRPEIGGETGFNSNAGLATESQKERADLVTRVSPGLSLRGRGPRASFALDGRFSRYLFLENERFDENRVDLTGNGLVVVDDTLFVEGQALVDQRFDNLRGPTSNSDLNFTDNRRTRQNYRVSPFARFRFGNWADIEPRIAYRRLDIDSDRASDTNSFDGVLTVASGPAFTDLLWRFTFDSEYTDRSRAPSLTALQARTDFEYVVNRQFSALFGAGYENIDDDTRREEPEGAIWHVGMRFEPTEELSTRVVGGEEGGGTFVTADLTYQPTSRTTLRMLASKGIVNEQSVLSEDLFFLEANEDRGFTDTRTGRPFAAGDPAFFATDNAFDRERVALSLSRTDGRNEFEIEALADQREVENSNEDRTVVGAGFEWSRRITKRTTAGLNLSFRYLDFTTGQEQQLIYRIPSAQVDIEHQLSENLTGRATYYAQKRFSSEDGDDLTENVVSVGLRYRF